MFSWNLGQIDLYQRDTKHRTIVLHLNIFHNTIQVKIKIKIIHTSKNGFIFLYKKEYVIARFVNEKWKWKFEVLFFDLDK